MKEAPPYLLSTRSTAVRKKGNGDLPLKMAQPIARGRNSVQVRIKQRTAQDTVPQCTQGGYSVFPLGKVKP